VKIIIKLLALGDGFKIFSRGPVAKN